MWYLCKKCHFFISPPSLVFIRDRLHFSVTQISNSWPNTNIFVKENSTEYEYQMLNIFISRQLTEYEYQIYSFLTTWPNMNIEYICSYVPDGIRISNIFVPSNLDKYKYWISLLLVLFMFMQVHEDFCCQLTTVYKYEHMYERFYPILIYLLLATRTNMNIDYTCS